jgi:uncharacterized protein (TIGR03067 family)
LLATGPGGYLEVVFLSQGGCLVHKRLTILALTGLSLAFAPAPFPRPDPGKNDLKKLQGVWQPIALTLESGVPAVQFPWDRMEIVQDRMTYFKNGAPVCVWILTLDPRKTPKVLDVRAGEGPTARYEGVYQLRGSTLSICSAQPRNGGRPECPTACKPGQLLEVFQRPLR